MRVGISSACFYPETVLDASKHTLSFGVPVMEIFLNSIHELSNDNLEAVKKNADNSGTQIVSVHPFTAVMEGMLFFSGYKDRIYDGLSLYERFFAAANTLGAKYFVFHGDRKKTTYGQKQMPEDDMCEIYYKLIHLAQKYDIIFTQENVAQYRSEDPIFLQKLYKNLGNDIHFTYDIKQEMRAGLPFLSVYEAQRDALSHIHINDFGFNECCLPFEGNIDFAKLKRRLCEDNYCGDCVIEVYKSNIENDEALKSSLLKTRAFFEE